MNTTIKTIALALGLSFANSVMAQEPGITLIDNEGYIAKVISVPNTNTMKVYVGNIKSKNLTFSLKDNSGNVLYTKYIYKDQPQANLKVSLDELPDGIYNVEMSDKVSKTVKSFRKGNEFVMRPIGTLVAVK